MGKDSWPLDYDEQGKLCKRSPANGELVPLDGNTEGLFDDLRAAAGAEYEFISDPANNRPYGREFMRKHADFIAWMRGEMPEYRPTVYEVVLLRPAYLERQERVKENVALKSTEKNDEKRTYRLRDLWVHVRGYDEHGEAYGVAADEQAVLHTAWRPLRHELRKRATAGQSDRELLEGWLDHLEHDKGFNRTDLLNVPLDDWRGLLADPSPPVPPLISPLTENDRALLQAMLELKASMAKPETAKVIVRTALYSGDAKRAFKNLDLNGLVDSKKGKSGGYWLTSHGETVAKSLALIGAT